MYKQLVGVRSTLALALIRFVGFIQATPACAADEAELNAGETAWILISTGLVLFMTIPALALSMAGWQKPSMRFQC